MSIWGKLLAGAAELAPGGPLGALLRAVIGRVGGSRRKRPAEDGRLLARGIVFTIGTIVLGAKLAKADGIVTRHEVSAFKEVFHIPPGEMDNVARLYDRARRDSAGFEPYARQIARLLKGHPAVLEDLLDGLFHIARADGRVHEAEIDYLRAVARIFGFSDEEFRRIRACNDAQDADDPHILLGVPPDAPIETVRAAHRRLVLQLHPDRLMAQGVPPEFLEIANDKLAAINAAWDHIRRDRDLT